MGTYLDDIIAAHRAADTVATATDGQRALASSPVRGFAAALRAREGLDVIAEVKRRSPSKGDLAPDLVPSVLAKTYESAGAAAVSVLTDERFFGGSAADLIEARAAVDLPVLRKDFTVGERDVYEARALGADAVLLIVAALDDAELLALHALAAELGMDALVEAHDEREVERALTAGAALIGVNQRDLETFAVDTDRAVRVAPSIPDGVVRVAESGVRTGDDARRLRDAGYDAVLVGEALVTTPEPARVVEELRACS